MLENPQAKALSCLLGVALSLLLMGPLGAQTTESASVMTVEVESSRPDAVHLRVSCGSPSATHVRIGKRDLPALALDDAGLLQEPGLPLVPRRRVLVEIPPGVEVRLETTVTLEEPLGRFDLPPAPRLTLDEVSGEPSAQTVPFPISRAPLPESLVRIESIGWLRHRRVACLELTPVRYQPTTGEAHVATDLRVILHFEGRVAGGSTEPVPVLDGPWFSSLYGELLVNPGTYYSSAAGSSFALPPPGAAAATGVQQPAAPSDLRWRLKVEADERGLYAITAADLASAGVNLAAVDPRRIGMSRRGASIAIEVQGESDGAFDPGDRVLFYAEPDVDRYRDVNAWWLFEVATGTGAGVHSARRMQTTDGTPQAGDTPVPYFRDTVRAEVSLRYWQTMPNGAGHDHWYWKRTLGPVTSDYTIATPHPEPGGSNARVRAALHGYTDTVQDPDHHTRLILNGAQIDDATWNGAVPFLHDVAVAAPSLQAGNNTLQVQQILDLGAVVDGIYSDWFEIEYDRDFVATADELAWSSDSTQLETFAVEQFSSASVHALVVTDTDEVLRVVNPQVDNPGGGFRVTFRHAPGGAQRYFLADESALRSPLSLAPGSAPIDVPPLGADLLVVAEDGFAGALAPLVQLREQSGLRVTRVSPQAIYDTYSYGEFNPEAIADFVRDAFENWTAPAPSFVLMVGEASLDYRDHWGNGPWNSAPGYLYQSPNDIELPSDHFYVAVAGADVLPDLFIGRLPAASPAEASTLVAKILSHETAPPAGGWRNEVVHVADFGAQFVSALTTAAQQVPAPYSVTDVFADALGSTSATRAAIKTQLDQGCAIGTYFGHGSVLNWGVQLWSNADVNGLSNGDRLPLILALNCLNGFFALYDPPNSPPRSLAEEFVLEPGGGAVACIAPSGLGQIWEQLRLLEHVYGRAFGGEGLGQAHTGAKLDAYLIDSASVDNLWSLVLFGDPSGVVLP